MAPTVVTLPDLHNPSQLEEALHGGSYELSSEYDLKVTEDASHIINLCILKKRFSRVSACLKIGVGQFLLACDPDMRPDCLPSSIIEHFFGVSLWFPPELFNESKVIYSMVDIDSSEKYARRLTNTTTLSAVWYDVLSCHIFIELMIAVIICGIVVIICCLGGSVCCYRICCRSHKPKQVAMDTPTVAYGQLLRQEQDEEVATSNQEEVEVNDAGQSSEPLEGGGDEEEVSLGPNELNQDGLLAACQGVSSSEEEDVHSQLLSIRVSSKESVRTAVSERGYRRHGRRSRFVPTNRPMVGYSTDTTSMSGAPTDVSTNDASDEDSNDDVHGQLSSSSSSSAAMLVQEATRLDTPPPFARLHPTTVYDYRPGVTTEPREPPDGN